MFENILKFFKKGQKGKDVPTDSKSAAKERLHLVLMQDRANVSADFLDLMKQEIIEVIKKYIEVDEGAIDVRLTNKENEDGTNGAPALYANIPILNIKNEARKVDSNKTENKETKKEIKNETKKEDVKADKTEKTKKEEVEEKLNVEEKTDSADDVVVVEEVEKEEKENEEVKEDSTTENK